MFFFPDMQNSNLMIWKLFWEDSPPSIQGFLTLFLSLSCTVSLCAFNSPRSKNFHSLSNKYLGDLASWEQTTWKTLWKMSTQSYGKYNVFFKHLKELSLLFHCCIYRDIFWCPQTSPVQWPCARYEAQPCTDLGLSLSSCKSRDRGEGEENRRSPGLQFSPLEWGFAPNFSIPAWAPLA